MRRVEMLDALAGRIAAFPVAHPARVAVDGVDAAGKTILADQLADHVERRGRPVIRASIDGFHRPRAERYRRGADSPDGYYLDSFNYAALRDVLLVPLGPGGSRRYRRAVFDFRADSPIVAPEEEAPVSAVLVMDGVFLQRPELYGLWDYRIFVEARFAVALERAERRDAALFGSAEAVRARYERRYIPGQRLYFTVADPARRADAIVGNDDPEHPTLALRDAVSWRVYTQAD